MLVKHFKDSFHYTSESTLSRVDADIDGIPSEELVGLYRLVGPDAEGLELITDTHPDKETFSFFLSPCGQYIVYSQPARTELVPYQLSLINAVTQPRTPRKTKFDHIFSSLVNRIAKSATGIVICYMSGGSGSGKTTVAGRIRTHILRRSAKFGVATFGLDGYQNARRLFPKRPDGQYDMESLQCLRLDAIRKDLTEIVQGRAIRQPVFDWVTGEFTERAGETIQVRSPGILIVEGLHALNPLLMIDDVSPISYKIFVQPTPTYRYSETCLGIGHREYRILRRIHRDVLQERNTPEGNLNAWASVMEGEAKWIFPFLPNVDFVFNSSLCVELSRMVKEGLDGVLGAETRFPLALALRGVLEVAAIWSAQQLDNEEPGELDIGPSEAKEECARELEEDQEKLLSGPKSKL